MRMTSLFIRTLREAPSQAVLPSHQWLERAGYVQEIGKGSFALLPFGLQAVQRLERSFAAELGVMPVPLQIPQALSHEGAPTPGTGLSFSDTQMRQLKLPSNPDLVMDEIARQHFTSYKQLPAYASLLHSPWTDDVHPGSGPLYSRMPRTLSLYGFFVSPEERDAWRDHIRRVLSPWLAALGLPILHACSPGCGNKSETLEWFYRHPAGRSMVYTCTTCGYTASQQHVRFFREATWQEPPRPLESIHTPGCKTIESLSLFLGIPRERTAKAVFLSAVRAGREQLVVVIVPGSRDLDEQRLAQAAGLTSWRPASEEEISAAGIVAGYGSAVGIKDVFVAVDTDVSLTPNLVAGANRVDYHLLNVNYGRDFTASLVAEITQPVPGDRCPHCRTIMQVEPGVKIAGVTAPAGSHVVMDANGKMAELQVLACHLNSLRLLTAAAEAHHDEHGLILPRAAAPFQVYLALLPDKEGQAQKEADRIYAELQTVGIDTLYDDRNERAGVKFNDADLIGIPLRITVSQRGVSSGIVELKARQEAEPARIPLEEILPQIRGLLIQ